MARPRLKPAWYRELYAQVLIGMVAGVIVGHLYPALGEELKPLGDTFVRMIKMVVGPVIFCTVVSALGGAGDLKRVARVGGKALIYFEVVSTIALLIGALVANVVRPGSGFTGGSGMAETQAVSQYTAARAPSSAADFLLGIVPNTIIDAFAKGDILPVVFVSVLFGYALSRMGARGAPMRAGIEAASHLVFGVINIVVRFAPLGAFGAMAYTVARFGMQALRPLLLLIGTFYATCAMFVLLVLGAILMFAGVNIVRLLRYLKSEILITLGASSSDAALPTLMAKLTNLGCPKSVVSLVVPTGYIFNADGTSIYVTLAALFIAQAMNIDLTWTQQLAIFAVSLLTSKGASGVTGAGLVALVGTLSAVPTIPLAGIGLILGVDRFMSEARALVNLVGNAVATIMVASTEPDFDKERMRRILRDGSVEEQPTALDSSVREPSPLPAAAARTEI